MCGRCGRDFAKLVERIADQRRFEDEQRAARAAEKAYDEGGAGGDSAAEAGNRKPKGLVWEVRSPRGVKRDASNARRPVLCVKSDTSTAMCQRRDAKSVGREVLFRGALLVQRYSCSALRLKCTHEY